MDPSSDMEEQEGLLAGERDLSSARGVSSKRLLLASLGIAALVCLAVFAGVEVKGRGAGRKKLSRQGLPDLIQAHALERLGRELTPQEVGAVSAHLVGTGPTRAAKARTLEQINNLGHMGESDLEDSGISEACAQAVMDLFLEGLQKLSDVISEILMACMFDEEGDACLAAQAKGDKLAESLIEDCKADGDICNVTTTEEIDGVQERSSEMVCVPSVCHEEVKSIVELLDKNMNEDVGAAVKKESKRGWVKKEMEKKDEDEKGMKKDMEMGAPSQNITCG